jgi:hypothetical protein
MKWFSYFFNKDNQYGKSGYLAHVLGLPYRQFIYFVFFVITTLTAAAYFVFVQWMFSYVIFDKFEDNGLTSAEQHSIIKNWLDMNVYTLDTGILNDDSLTMPPILGLGKLLGTGKALKCIGILSIEKSPMSNFVYRVRGAATYSIPNDGVIKGGAEQIDMHVPIYSYYSYDDNNYVLMYSKVVNDVENRSFLPSMPTYEYTVKIPKPDMVKYDIQYRDIIYYTERPMKNSCVVSRFTKTKAISDHYLVNTYEELLHSISQFGTLENITYAQYILEAPMNEREINSGHMLDGLFRAYRKQLSSNMKMLDDLKKSRR